MNITEAKALFFAQYLGQKFVYQYTDKTYSQSVAVNGTYIGIWQFEKPPYSEPILLLRTVEQLTDTEVQQMAKFAHQMPNSNFIIKRDHDIIHAEHLNKIGIEYHISLYKNYGTVNANIHFSKTKDEPSKTFKANIGETTFSSRLPVPYIAICDYMRVLGVLLQFTYLNEENKPVTLSPDDIIKLGWVKIKE